MFVLRLHMLEMIGNIGINIARLHENFFELVRF